MWIVLTILVLAFVGLAALLRQGAREHEGTALELAAIRALDERAARSMALSLLADASLFACTPTGPAPALDGLPEGVRDLFRQFEEVRRGEFWLGHGALAARARLAGFRKIGEDFEFEEVIVQPSDNRVYSSYGDAPAEEPPEPWPSVWHRIIAASGRNVL